MPDDTITITITDPPWQRIDVPSPPREWIGAAPIEAQWIGQPTLGPIKIEPGGGLPLPHAVPEPSGICVLGAALVGLIVWRAMQYYRKETNCGR